MTSKEFLESYKLFLYMFKVGSGFVIKENLRDVEKVEIYSGQMRLTAYLENTSFYCILDCFNAPNQIIDLIDAPSDAQMLELFFKLHYEAFPFSDTV